MFTSMAAIGRVNRENKRVCPGLGHIPLKLFLDLCGEFDELLSGLDRLGKGLDERMLDRDLSITDPQSDLDGRPGTIPFRICDIYALRLEFFFEEFD
ncbi:hypothetical protein CV103_01605 [Sphingomonas fennica]|uniref:Uncharacterized protein n=1 Tax=Edaphosphingomonas fennica TaxID=114404 RepID=A0A2T4I7V7_9SPHN|nr:hypothetical protein CV103_01605 [Sphingomonas fennica]